jgi:hypothetical protein
MVFCTDDDDEGQSFAGIYIDNDPIQAAQAQEYMRAIMLLMGIHQ